MIFYLTFYRNNSFLCSLIMCRTPDSANIIIVLLHFRVLSSGKPRRINVASMCMLFKSMLIPPRLQVLIVTGGGSSIKWGGVPQMYCCVLFVGLPCYVSGYLCDIFTSIIGIRLTYLLISKVLKWFEKAKGGVTILI